MNRLTTDQRCAVVRALCEGNSVLATCRMTGIAKQTVLTLLLELGRVCLNHEDRAIRRMSFKHLECDELWGFVGCKDRHLARTGEEPDGRGSAWVWYTVDRESKLIVNWLVGDRDREHAVAFMRDLASRLRTKPQLSTDSLNVYAGAVAEAFHSLGVDYGQIHKVYKAVSEGERTYSPSQCVGCERKRVRGKPDMKAVGTSGIERANLTTRMSQRRWTRLTNAHSKSFAHHEAAFALHSCFYNWVRPHLSLDGQTPAQAAGLADRRWRVEDLVGLLEAEEQAEIAAGALKRGKYRPRQRNSD